MKVLDIGGGFTSDSFDRAAEEIRSSRIELKQNFPDIHVIAEPGRLFANDVFSLAVQVIGRRGASGDSEERRLYLNDGVFGNFMNCVFEKASYKPIAVVHSGEIRTAGSEGGYSYSLWGPTCDCDDCIAREAQFGQEVEIGDWLIFEGVGGKQSDAYSMKFPLTKYCSIYQRLSNGIQWF